MRVEAFLDSWIICRGKGEREQNFAFFVGADSSSWTSQWGFHRFKTNKAAWTDLRELRRRAKQRRKRAQANNR